MDASYIKRVVEIGVREALGVRHEPPCIVRLEGCVFNDWEEFDLVVSFSNHPRTLAREWLDKAAKGVPKWLVSVGVGEVAGK